MKRSRVEILTNEGLKLAGLMELPEHRPHAYALFAHCFTCSKNIAAASRIAQGLAQQGYGVLRFDFTGLGNSEGEFSNSNFSSNVADLVAAANFLRDNYAAPRLMVGHSLGGTAVLLAAHEVPECKAVVSVGSPSSAEHVAKQFSCDIAEIEAKGEATVSLAGREFTIKKQFIDDLKAAELNIASLKKSLLVMHSPIDAVVSINEAASIFQSAKHPKSFVSLDNADHLLTKTADAQYVALTIAAWASRFINDADVKAVEESRPTVAAGHVVIEEKDGIFTQDVFTDHHHWLADEPLAVGGGNAGPDPYEHLLAALGTCTVMTLRLYANRKKWAVGKISVSLSHSRDHGSDCVHCDDDHAQIDLIDRTISVTGQLSASEQNRLLEIADRCPVHRTLHNKLVVQSQLDYSDSIL